jgi:hypothetical protein
MLRKINLNEKKIHVPELGLEPTTPQITQNQAKLNLNAITTGLPKVLGAREDKVIGVINKHSTFTIKVNFWPKKAIFCPFPPRETYAKLILLKKANFYHKMIFL